jgi:hypothetical protein
MDFFQTGRITWSIYPLLGWGIGIFFHTMGVFWTQGEDFEKEFEKWRQERRSKEALPE